jgi:hypothetical protein
VGWAWGDKDRSNARAAARRQASAPPRSSRGSKPKRLLANRVWPSHGGVYETLARGWWPTAGWANLIHIRQCVTLRRADTRCPCMPHQMCPFGIYSPRQTPIFKKRSSSSSSARSDPQIHQQIRGQNVRTIPLMGSSSRSSSIVLMFSFYSCGGHQFTQTPMVIDAADPDWRRRVKGRGWARCRTLLAR